MGTGTDVLDDADLGITELLDFEPDRLDGVKEGATKIGFLMMKSIAAPEPPADAPEAGPEPEPAAKGEKPAWHAPAAVMVRMAKGIEDLGPAALWKAVSATGQLDEQPDIDGGRQALMLLFKLIGYEAAEGAAGRFDESYDIALLGEAALLLRCWLSGEQAAAANMATAGCGCCLACTGPGCGCCGNCNGMTGKSLGDEERLAALDELGKALLSGKDKNDLPDSAFAFIEDGGKKDADGKTTPRSKRHFPVHDKAHADNAAARIAAGAQFGDKAKRKVKAAQAKFAGDAGKSAVAEGATDVHTDLAEGALTKDDLDAAVTKALGTSEERFRTLEAGLAKVMAQPTHGGPVLSASPRPATAPGPDVASIVEKAAYYEQMADQVSPDLAVYYRQLASDEKARLPAP